MNSVIYAVGDVHGRIDLLTQLYEHIQEFHQLVHSGKQGKIVHVGDYIDGGAHSAEVIDRLMLGVQGFHCSYLMGNHEAMMLECLATDNRQVWYTWLSNGGDETLASLGVSLRLGGYDPAALKAALGEERISWLRSLPYYLILEPYLFVHAGIVPGIPIEEQQEKDLLWIRSRFLDSEEDHGRMVVHGHTPGDEAVVRQNRICVDTGATSNGLLTAAVLEDTKAPLFLRAVGRPGKTS